MNITANHSESTSANYSAKERAVSLYDVPFFATPAFLAAASAFNFWAGEHTVVVNEVEAANEEPASRPVTQAETLRADMRLYQPDLDVVFSEWLLASVLIKEVLDSCVEEVHELHVQYRGHYLAQLSARWYCDGTLDPLRFQVAHMLSVYFAAMPSIGSTCGLLDSPEEMTLVGWSNIHGGFVDVVSAFSMPDDYVDDVMIEAFSRARKQFPRTLRGLRYLPLDDMRDARFYLPDGTCEPLTERTAPRSP